MQARVMQINRSSSRLVRGVFRNRHNLPVDIKPSSFTVARSNITSKAFLSAYEATLHMSGCLGLRTEPSSGCGNRMHVYTNAKHETKHAVTIPRRIFQPRETPNLPRRLPETKGSTRHDTDTAVCSSLVQCHLFLSNSYELKPTLYKPQIILPPTGLP